MKQDRSFDLSSIQLETERIFAPEGGLSKTLDNYETREQQAHLAGVVAHAIATNDHLLAEAGTGTGKSLAYLVPVLLSARAGLRACISTHTITLQDQLLKKDIPLAQRATGCEEIRVERVLGRGNYLCLRKLRSSSPDMFNAPVEAIDELADWAESDPEGIRGNHPHSVPFWHRVASRGDDCPMSNCLYYKQCFYQAARKREREAQVLVINHSLLCADLAVRRGGGARLDEYELLVVDEAHALPDVAADALSTVYSRALYTYALDDLAPTRGVGLADKWHIPPEKQEEIRERCAALRLCCLDQHRALLEATRNYSSRIKQRNYAQDMLSEPTGEMVNLLAVVASGLESPEKEEALSIASRLNEQTRALSANLDQLMNNHVYYRDGIDDTLALVAKPLDAGEMLRLELWCNLLSSISVSATLAVDGDMSFSMRRLGLTEAIMETIPGGFDYKKQLTIYIPRHLPDPNLAEFDAEVANEIVRLGAVNHGGMLCLFTSYRALDITWTRAGNELKGMGYEVLRQGEAPREKLLNRMKHHGRVALFGTSSFWEGIDVPGSALSALAICRMPFVPPDDPFEDAMRERIKERGGSDFTEWSLPRSIVRLRQGIGRLIRRHDDHGIAAIFDSRIHIKNYGKSVIRSLPPGHLIFSLNDFTD